MKLFWGDLHNHCGITYGFGSLENALEAARNQLDFCSVTGHAMWPDIFEKNKETEFLVDFHLKGFEKLRKNWDSVRTALAEANVPNEFVTFQGYEIHSCKHGDHHIVSPSDRLDLVEASSPADLVERLSALPAISILHHAGYTPGYRGANWESFSEKLTPVVEVYSKHGCGMSDLAAYPYLHTMGPRDSRSTIFTGLKAGHRFGFVASTDHHAGYPGSYGDGRVAVLATEKTREAIWDALISRRTYAVTGDKIACSFELNGCPMGSEAVCGSARSLELKLNACDFLDKVIIYKNLKPWHVLNGEMLKGNSKKRQTYKVRVELGWGRSNKGYDWNGTASIRDGRIISVEPCFRGRSILAPTPEMKEDPDINYLNNKILSQSGEEVNWVCTTFKNPSTVHSQTNAMIIELEGDAATVFELKLNTLEMELTIGELLQGSRSAHVKPFNSEAVIIHRAVPEFARNTIIQLEDTDTEADCDIYHAEIRQMNNQYAWISPIFAVR